jgi:hypothetical protein
LVSPAVFFAAVAEAKRIGLPIAGHLQKALTPPRPLRPGSSRLNIWAPATRSGSGARPTNLRCAPTQPGTQP